MNISIAFTRRLPKHNRNIFRISNNLNKYSTQTDDVEIPKRIHRGPTDILRALESTISRDPTAAHYKYHDDPYLIPMSNIGKRVFAMAQEAGRKAAHWVRKEHADLFQHQEAEPPIKMFYPPKSYNESSEVTEEDLKELIENVDIGEIDVVYKLMKDKGVDISPETQQSLLELLCFYNCEAPLPEEFIEERWFRQSSKLKERQRKTWKDGALAEEVFIGISNPSSEAYSALIQGMAKHYQVDRAWQLFEEAQEKNLQLNTGAFNALISVVNFLKEDYDLRWSLVLNLLNRMNSAKLKPNLGTLNAVLSSLSTMGVTSKAKENSLKTLSEFKRLGIEPSLASWYYILITFCKERGPKSTILNDILNEIENKEFKIRDLNDTNFFVTAMDICRHHLYDLGLARRVDKLLHFGSNYDLIGDSYKESIYYRHYFCLMCDTEPLEDFMKSYNLLVPNIYVPEPSVMGTVLKHIEATGAIEHLPKLWSDMIIFDHHSRENLLELVLNIMVTNRPSKESNLDERFAVISWDIYSRIENQNENKTNKLLFTGDMLGKILILLIRNKEFDKAWTVMQKLEKNSSKIAGIPNFEAFSQFVDLCIEEKAPSKAITCIQYCSDAGFPDVEQLVAKLHKGLTLDERYLESLKKIVGEHVIDLKS